MNNLYQYIKNRLSINYRALLLFSEVELINGGSYEDDPLKIAGQINENNAGSLIYAAILTKGDYTPLPRLRTINYLLDLLPSHEKRKIVNEIIEKAKSNAREIPRFKITSN